MQCQKESIPDSLGMYLYTISTPRRDIHRCIVVTYSKAGGASLRYEDNATLADSLWQPVKALLTAAVRKCMMGVKLEEMHSQSMTERSQLLHWHFHRITKGASAVNGMYGNGSLLAVSSGTKAPLIATGYSLFIFTVLGLPCWDHCGIATHHCGVFQ